MQKKGEKNIIGLKVDTPIVTHRGIMGKINFDIIKIAKNTFLPIPFMRH